MKNRVKNTFLYATAFLLCVACAKIGSPIGGAKDEIAPEIVEASHEIPAINFTDKKLEFKFNEFISLKDASQIVVSPRLKDAPKFEARGKKLLITLPDSLNQKATYSIQLNDQVVDFTEGNPKNLPIQFTADTALDSASVAGTILWAKTMQPLADKQLKLEVGLYPAEAFTNSLLFDTPSFYFSAVDEAGNFKIQTIGAGAYRLFALADANGNNRLDADNELLAYASEVIQINDSTEMDGLQLFWERGFRQKENLLKKTDYVSRETFSVHYERAFDSIAIKTIPNSPNIQYQANLDSVLFYQKMAVPMDSVQLILQPLGNEKADSIWLKNDTNLYVQNILPLFESNTKQQFDFFKAIELPFNLPISEVKEELILVQKKIDSTRTDFFSKQISWELNQLKIESAEAFDSASFELILLPEAVMAMNQTSNLDTLSLRIIVNDESQFGELDLKLEWISPDSLLQRIETEANLRVEMSNPQWSFERSFAYQKSGLQLENLKAGTYKLYLFSDTNGNGKWDEGNYFEKMKSEPVFSEESIELRPTFLNEIFIRLRKEIPKE